MRNKEIREEFDIIKNNLSLDEKDEQIKNLETKYGVNLIAQRKVTIGGPSSMGQGTKSRTFEVPNQQVLLVKI